MSYPSLSRCSLVAASFGVLVFAALAGCWALGLSWPFEFALLVCPGAVFFLDMPRHPSSSTVVTLWAFALFATVLIYVLVGHIVFYVWRWRARRSPRA